MPTDARVQQIHHVGHVVRDMKAALDCYQKLGFSLGAPAYPTMSLLPGEPARPFGAANTHANFAASFIEIATVISQDTAIPQGAKLVALQIPTEAHQRIVAMIRQTVASLQAYLARSEGLKILVFRSDDVGASAKELELAGVAHGGVTAVQRAIDTVNGPAVAPVRYLEIDSAQTPEGRIAFAENPPDALLAQQPDLVHANGAFDLAGCVLCVPDGELEAYVHRYALYLRRTAAIDRGACTFDLGGTQMIICEPGSLQRILPGEQPPEVPAFVGCVIKVRDIEETARLLVSNQLPYRRSGQGQLLVPAACALGAAIVFQS